MSQYSYDYPYSIKVTSIKSGKVEYLLPSTEINLINYRLFKIKTEEPEGGEKNFLIEAYSNKGVVEDSESLMVCRETYLKMIGRNNVKAQQMGIGSMIVAEPDNIDDIQRILAKLKIAKSQNTPVTLDVADMDVLISSLAFCDFKIAI